MSNREWVSIKVERGQCLLIHGPIGCGKSAMARMIFHEVMGGSRLHIGSINALVVDVLLKKPGLNVVLCEGILGSDSEMDQIKRLLTAPDAPAVIVTTNDYRPEGVDFRRFMVVELDKAGHIVALILPNIEGAKI